MPTATTLDALPTGSEGIVLTTPSTGDEGPLLRAMGLEPGERLRVTRQGHPCIVEIRGSRIGIASVVSQQVMVTPAS